LAISHVSVRALAGGGDFRGDQAGLRDWPDRAFAMAPPVMNRARQDRDGASFAGDLKRGAAVIAGADTDTGLQPVRVAQDSGELAQAQAGRARRRRGWCGFTVHGALLADFAGRR
jgi:hypothetical protein